MVVEAKSYLTALIEWARSEDPEYPYEAEHKGHKLLVRLNDFPEAQLYALIADGEEITNFDDWPNSWTRPSVSETSVSPHVHPNLGFSFNDKRLVFVSHCSEDAYIARHMASDILTRGARCFLDIVNISVGENFEQKIRQTLAKADELVVLITPWALDKPYIWMEIGAAWFREIPTVVILLGLTPKEFQAHPDFPVHLKSLNIIHLNEIDKYLGQLEKRVRAR